MLRKCAAALVMQGPAAGATSSRKPLDSPPVASPFQILIIDDSPEDREKIRRLLVQGSARDFQFSEAASGAEARAAIAAMSGPPDCILLDFQLPDMDAIELLGHLRHGGELTLAPVVVLTESEAGEAAVIPAGAQDYLGKSWAGPEGLARAIENAVERYALARERLLASENLRLSEEFSRTVLQSTPDCVKVIDRDGILLDMNEPGRCLLELDSAADVLGREWWQVWPPECREMVRRAFQDALHGNNARFEGFSPTAKGTPKWWDVQVSPVKRPDGTIDRVVAVSRDVTAQRLSHRVLQETSERLALGLDVSGFCLAHVDYRADEIHLTSGAAALFGLGSIPVTVKRDIYHSTFHPDDRAEAEARIAEALQAEGRNLFIMDHRVVWPDGSIRWVRVHKRVFFENGVAVRGIMAAMDITAAKHAELELAHAARRKDQFLAMLAHELRNPLAPLLTGMDVILRTPENTAAVVKVGEMMKRQVDQMSHLIDDLLDVSRITNDKIELQLKEVPLGEIIGQAAESVQPLIDRHQHRLAIEQPARDLTLRADRHRLTQVISNLLTNAAKYTPPGGDIRLSASAAGRNLEISVRDSGQGIEPEDQSRIFELFAQGGSSSAEGLGIGLTLVKSLVEMHGGKVAVKSDGAGKGSTFTVRLPVVVAESPAATACETPDAHDPPRVLRVLVADDGKATADILGLFFQMEGLECRVVYDGSHAVATAAGFHPDLVCLDLGMPVIDGIGAARRIRETRPDAYFVALSGWGTDDHRQKTTEAGFDEHLVKPVNPDDLRRMISRAIERRRQVVPFSP